MVVAVFADFKSFQHSAPDLYFAKSLINKLSTRYTPHKFYFMVPGIIDNPGSETFPFLVIPLAIKPGLLYQYRVNRKLVRELRKVKADVLLSIDANWKVSLPQSILFCRMEGKKFPLAAVGKIRSVFVLSEEVKERLILHHRIDGQKIRILYGGPSEIAKPVSEEFKTSIKNKYTEGREFFIYRGSIGPEQNIIKLLKGFSLFKKRQRTSMKLVLMGKQNGPHNEFEKIISTYKYREDVTVVSDINEEEEISLMASSYAYIQPYASNSFLFVLDAMLSGIPVVMENSIPLKNNFAESVLYFDAGDDVSIAEKMMMIYKDEEFCKELIEKGKRLASQYNWQESLEKVWQNLQNPQN